MKFRPEAVCRPLTQADEVIGHWSLVIGHRVEGESGCAKLGQSSEIPTAKGAGFRSSQRAAGSFGEICPRLPRDRSGGEGCTPRFPVVRSGYLSVQVQVQVQRVGSDMYLPQVARSITAQRACACRNGSRSIMRKSPSVRGAETHAAATPVRGMPVTPGAQRRTVSPKTGQEGTGTSRERSGNPPLRHRRSRQPGKACGSR